MKTRKLPSLFAALGFLATTLSTASAQGPSRNAPDHLGGYNFLLEIDGIEAGHFTGVDGLSLEMDVIEYQDGDDIPLRKRPRHIRFDSITLKRGYIFDPIAWDWWFRASTDRLNSPKCTLSIIMQDPATNAQLLRWDLYGCWPKTWKVNSFDGKGNDVVTEEITFGARR